jgi:hypothetical protein
VARAISRLLEATIFPVQNGVGTNVVLPRRYFPWTSEGCFQRSSDIGAAVASRNARIIARQDTRTRSTCSALDCRPTMLFHRQAGYEAQRSSCTPPADRNAASLATIRRLRVCSTSSISSLVSLQPMCRHGRCTLIRQISAVQAPVSYEKAAMGTCKKTRYAISSLSSEMKRFAPQPLNRASSNPRSADS